MATSEKKINLEEKKVELTAASEDTKVATMMSGRV